MNLLCIAGFLGSGKTTVLLEIARAMVADGLRLAVVENEIGEVGIDGEYVRRNGLPVQELFGGCICCTLQARLVDTLRKVEKQYDPHWVIVEPTGLAAPGDFLGPVGERLREIGVTRVLTLVDAVRWEMLVTVVEPLITAQVNAADVVAINKIDEVTGDALAAVREDVLRLVNDTPVMAVSATTGAGMDRLLGAIL